MISSLSTEHEERSNSSEIDTNSIANSLFSDSKSGKLNNEFPLKDKENKTVNSSNKKGEQLDTKETKCFIFNPMILDIINTSWIKKTKHY
jgi:hypothetical protein